MLSRLRTVITLLRHPKVPRLPKFLLIAAIGYVLLPFDAIPEVIKECQYVSPLVGGAGCVRDVVEKVLKLHGKWDWQL